MAEGFAGFRCWDRERMSNVVLGDIAALAQDADPVFLALHTQLPLYRRQSTGRYRQVDEYEVRGLLLDDADENVVIAITGDAGSGKSHLIRWLKAHVQASDSRRVIYVPRLRTGLRSVLELILAELEEFAPDKVERLRTAMREAADAYPGEAIHDRLLDELKTHLKYRSDPIGDDLGSLLLGESADPSIPGGGRVGGLSDLMLNPHVREHLLRSGGPIRSLSEQFFHNSEEERSGELAFSGVDLDFTIPSAASALDTKSRRVYNLLRADGSTRSRAADLLNEAAGSAVATVLGMRSGPSLVEIVADARVALKEARSDLVLLIEDMYKVGAEDLYELFVEQPVGGQCLLRVAYAITPGPFLKAPETVLSRLRAHIDLSPEDAFEAGETESLAREISFIGRYLNVARLGRERVSQAWAETPTDASTGRSWVPNYCDQGDNGHPCPHLDKCRDEAHDFAFGNSGEDNYGLYPFNAGALATALRALRGAEEAFNPRKAIKDLVRDFLPGAGQEIAEGFFPSDASTSSWVAGLSEMKSELEVVPEFADRAEGDSTRRRVLNYRRFWMDQAALAAPPGPTEAFRLPREGEKVTITQPTVPPIEPARPKPRSRPIEIEQIARWQADERFPDATSRFIRDELLSLVRSRVDWATHAAVADNKAVSDDVVARLISIASFDIEGGSGSPPGQRLSWTLKRSDRSVRIFNALVWFRDHHHWAFDDGSWDFPGAGYAAQLELESFIDGCVRDIARRIDELRSPDSFPPFDAAIRLLALTHLLLHPASIDSSPADVVRGMLVTPEEPVASGYMSLDQMRQSAVARFEELRKVVLDLATVRLPSGDYQAVDHAALLDSVVSVLTDPTVPRVARKDSAVVAAAVNALQRTPTVFAEVADSLRQVIERLPDEAWLTWDDNLRGQLKSIGRRANDSRVFTPATRYSQFLESCDVLGDGSPGDLEGLRAKVAPVADDDVRTIALLLPRVERLKNLGSALDTIQSCLEQTVATVREQVTSRASVDIEKQSRQLVAQLRRIVDLVRGLA